MTIDNLGDRPADRAGRGLAHAYFSLAHRLRWCGAENVPRTGPVILAANHQSFYDPVAICLAARRGVVYVGDEHYYHMPVVGYLMRLFGTIPVNVRSPSPAALAHVVRALRQGHVCGIFPEGARTPDGLIGRPQPGAAVLALRTGAPLVPVTVCGAYAAWPLTRRLPRPAPMAICFGEAMHVEGKSTRGRRWEILLELMLRIADGFRRLGRPDLARESRRRVLESCAP